MSDTNFQPIFDYIVKAKDELREEMATKADIARLENTVNSFASKEIIRDQESIVQKAKTQRIEHWVMKAAEKVEIP